MRFIASPLVTHYGLILPTTNRLSRYVAQCFEIQLCLVARWGSQHALFACYLRSAYTTPAAMTLVVVSSTRSVQPLPVPRPEPGLSALTPAMAKKAVAKAKYGDLSGLRSVRGDGRGLQLEVGLVHSDSESCKDGREGWC